MLEKHLKFWLNNAYSGQLNFVEPTYGSSLGMCDCEIPFARGIIQVETKIGTITRSGFLHVDLRPSQYRYHILQAEQGIPTAVLVAVGATTKFNVYTFAGRHVEGDAYKDNSWMVALDQRWTDIFSRNRLDEAWHEIVKGYTNDELSDSVL